MFENREFGLRSDELGFLVGQRRLERISKDINTDTQEIIRILTAMHEQRMANPPDNQLTGLPLAIAQANAQQTVDIVRSLRDVQRSVERVGARAVGSSPLGAPTVDIQDLLRQSRSNSPSTVPTRQTVDVRSNADLPDRLISPAPTDTTTSSSAQNPTGPADSSSGQDASPDTPSTDAAGPRNRDRRGRFTRDGADSADGGSDATMDGRANNGRRRGAGGRFEGDGQGDSAKQKTWFDRLRAAVSSGVSVAVDTRGVDPTVDAINELGSLMSPVKKAAGLVLKPMTALWRMRKRNEPLSREEREHNRRQLRELRDIARNQGGGGIGGMLRMVRIIPLALIAAAPIIGKAIWDSMKTGNKISDELNSTEAGRAFTEGVGEGTAVVASALGSETANEMLNTVPAGQSDTNKDGSSNIGKMGAWNRFGNFVGRKLVQDPLNWTNEKLGGDPDYWTDSSTTGAGVSKRSGSKGLPNGFTGEQKENQMMVYKALRSVGMTSTQARAMTAEVGRESSYLDKNIFGSHRDDKNGHSNMGMISWQKGRAENLKNFLASRGLLDKNGNMIKGAATIQAQAEFMMGEIQRTPKVKKYLADNPNATTTQLMDFFGRDFIQWRIDDPKYRSDGLKNRDINLRQLDRQLSSVSDVSGSSTVVPTANTTSEHMMSAVLTPSTEMLANSMMPTSSMQSVLRQAITPTALPTSAMSARTAPVLPPMPQPVTFRESLGSKPPQVVTVAQSSDSIGQNVGDRAIAHAVSGGLGMRTWEG